MWRQLVVVWYHVMLSGTLVDQVFMPIPRPRLYLFDGNADTSCWPEHNPCGVWKDNTGNHQKKGVSNPGGQIFLR